VARIAGVDIQIVTRGSRFHSLTWYGVGLTKVHKILAKAWCQPRIRARILEDGDIQKLRAAAESLIPRRAICAGRGHGPQRLQNIGCVQALVAIAWACLFA